MANKDLYETLGVSRGATAEEIKKAYKQMVKKYHPDLNPGDKEAEEKMKEVNHAYDILSDEQKKAQYDQFGDAAFDGTGGFNGAGGFGGFTGDFGGFGGGGFGDIFDAFFGGGGGQQQQRSGPRQGNDLQAEISITFEEAAKGVTKEIELTRYENCQSCNGTGAKPGTGRKTCPVCNGTGSIRVNQKTPFGQIQTAKTCHRCEGAGTIVEDPCNECHGEGRVRKRRKVKVNIPAGVDTGSRLRMQGQGEGGYLGGPAGDLYIYIRLKPHEAFTRDGDDVLCETTISMVDAALGCEVTVPTLEGNVKIDVPAGTQSGSTLRLRGKGFTHIRGYGKGDQHIKVKVTIPKSLNSEQKELLEKLKESLENNPPQPEKESKGKGFFGKKK